MTQTMTTQENYSLRWNNHQSHILQSFDALLQQKSLVDVTLVCSDRSIRAHKVVLSACSPFFERVFNDTPCKHPVIVLKVSFLCQPALEAMTILQLVILFSSHRTLKDGSFKLLLILCTAVKFPSHRRNSTC